MDDYLPKPLQLAEMERILTHWISVSAVDSLRVPGVANGSNPDGVLDGAILAQLHALEEPGEASLLTELIEAFRGSAPGHLAHLHQALAAGDARAFGDAAHALKGSAAVLGAERLRKAAYDLELRGRDNNLAHAGAQVAMLEAICAEAADALAAQGARPRRGLAA